MAPATTNIKSRRFNRTIGRIITHLGSMRPTALATPIIAIAIALMVAFTSVQPVEAAYRKWAPTASCNSLHRLDGKGTMSINHGLAASSTKVEYVAVAYIIQRRSGGVWRNYRSHSYLATVYPSHVMKVQFAPTHVVVPGTYRVQLSLGWYQNGVKRTWTGFASKYFVSHGSYQYATTGACRIL